MVMKKGLKKALLLYNRSNNIFLNLRPNLLATFGDFFRKIMRSNTRIFDDLKKISTIILTCSNELFRLVQPC